MWSLEKRTDDIIRQFAANVVTYILISECISTGYEHETIHNGLLNTGEAKLNDGNYSDGGDTASTLILLKCL